MGIIRLLLAIQVLLSHCPPGIIHRSLHPALAVQCFYAISGFLMQLAIPRYHEEGGRHWQISFYKSRLFRLMPLYWLFAVLTFVMYTHASFDALKSNGDVMGLLIYAINNVFLLGQDILRFFTYDTIAHHFSLLPPYTENLDALLNQHTILGNGLTIMGQSWTLAVELWFYLLAPFLLLRSNIIIVGCIAVSAVFRLWLAYLGYKYHTFMYGIIISELAIFLSGSLAARFYKHWLASGKLQALLAARMPAAKAQKAINIFGWVILGFILQYYLKGWRSFPHGGDWGQGLLAVPYRYWVVIAATVVALPWLLHSMGRCKWDRFIGDLSYPVYISHIFIVDYMVKLSVPEKRFGLYVIVASLLVSVALVYGMERPVDAWRHRKFLHADKESA